MEIDRVPRITLELIRSIGVRFRGVPPPRSAVLDHEIHLIEGGISMAALERVAYQDALTAEIKGIGECVPNPDIDRVVLTLSGFNNSDKFTEECQRCMVLILCGQNSRGEPNSLVLHMTTSAVSRPFLLRGYSEVRQFVQGTEVESRKALVLGGYYTSLPEDPYSHRIVYKALVRKVVGIAMSSFGIEPAILPPKADQGSTNVYLSNNDQKITVIQSVNSAPFEQTPFYRVDLDERARDWDRVLEERFERIRHRVKIY